MKKRTLIPLLIASALSQATTSTASELVYQPVNPSFGGSSLNGSYLLSNAQAQNDFKDPNYEPYEAPTALERLTSSLESRLISQLLADVGSGNTGFLATEDYTIQIDQSPDGTLTVNITDLLSNESTQIEVNGLIPD